MSESIPEVVVQPGCKDLCFVFQAAESTRVDDTIAVTLELVAIGMRKFRITASLRPLNREPQTRQS
jgi:hypothetical protein